MAMLIDTYHRSASGRIEEPDAVMVSTREYQRMNDFLADFLDSCVERVPDPTSLLLLDDAIKSAREWMRNDNPSSKQLRRKDLQSYMDKNLVRSCNISGKLVYKGYRLRLATAPVLTAEEEDPLDV